MADPMGPSPALVGGFWLCGGGIFTAAVAAPAISACQRLAVIAWRLFGSKLPQNRAPFPRHSTLPAPKTWPSPGSSLVLSQHVEPLQSCSAGNYQPDAWWETASGLSCDAD